MPPRAPIVPLIVAVALFMENLDGAVIATALPDVARDLGTDPIHLKLVLTSYLLALAVFIPASGWVADRFGARVVFRLAILIFAAGSVACGLAQDLGQLVAARVLQGIGGSMMVPVGRLILMKSTPRAELVNALAWLTVPALVGPLIGPPLGGFISTFGHWRWIFWINVPIALLGMILAAIHIPDVREEAPAPFDRRGFLLMGPGLSALLSGITLAGLGLAGPWAIGALVAVGLGLCLAYVFHAGRVAAPIIDLRLLALPSFRIAVLGGTMYRIGVGATPFLMPLMLQLGFGMTSFAAGLLTFVTAIGAMSIKPVAEPALARWGFRRVLVVNGVIAAGLSALPGLFWPGLAWAAMAAALLLGGLSRSLEFTALNAITYAEVPEARMSAATAFASVLQQLSGSVGITIAALSLESLGALRGVAPTDLGNFAPTYLLIGLVALGSVPFFARLSPGAGQGLVRKRVAGD